MVLVIHAFVFSDKGNIQAMMLHNMESRSMELKLEREERRARDLKEKEEREIKEKREREEQERKDHIYREELRIRELKEERKYEMEKLEKDRFNLMLMRFMCGTSTVSDTGPGDEARVVLNKEFKVQHKGEETDSQPKSKAFL